MRLYGVTTFFMVVTLPYARALVLPSKPLICLRKFNYAIFFLPENLP